MKHFNLPQMYGEPVPPPKEGEDASFYHCDVCGKPPEDGYLVYFTYGSYVCHAIECNSAAQKHWQLHCEECEKERIQKDQV